MRWRVSQQAEHSARRAAVGVRRAENDGVDVDPAEEVGVDEQV